jgi:hypothetical protein
VRALWWLLIHRPKKAGKPKTSHKKTAKKPARKQSAKHPSKLGHAAPRSGTTAKPRKAASPKPATVAA